MLTRLQARLLLAFSLLVIIPIVAAGVFVSIQIRTIQHQLVLSIQQETAKRVGTEFKYYMKGHEGALAQFLSVRGLVDLDLREKSRLISELLAHNTQFEEISLLNERAEEQIRHHRFRLITPDEMRKRSYMMDYRNTEDHRDAHIGGVYFDEETGEPLIRITLPILQIRTGRNAGFLTGVLRLKPIWDLLAQMPRKQGQQVFILDSEGRVVAHPNPSVVLRGTTYQLPPTPYGPGLGEPAAVIASQEIRAGEQIFTVVSERSEKEAFAVAARTLLLNFLVGTLALLMAVIMMILLLKQFVRPVKHLVKTAQEIEKGNLSLRAEIIRKDEVGELALAFNRMTDRIDRSVTELEREIHERKETEAALRESEDRYRLSAESLKLFRTLIDQSNDAIFVLATDTGRFLDANDTACKRLGYTLEELARMHITDIDNNLSTQLPWQEYVKTVRNELSSIRYSDYKCKDGSVFPVEINLTHADYGTGKFLVAVSRDLTERQALEEKLRQSRKMEAIGTLAGGIAHDFNNILGIIVGNTELALDAVPESNPARRNLQEIFTAGLRARDVVRQLLGFARKTTIEKHPVIIGPIIQETLSLMRASIPSTIQIRSDIEGNCKKILADPSQITQVLINLSTNAAHAMPDEGILEVILKEIIIDDKNPEVPSGTYVQLQVTDTGHGIQDDHTNRIFDPYFTTKEVGKGTGMGLAVVHGIIRDHQGFIQVRSRVGEGTTFSLLFPVTEGKPSSPSKVSERITGGDENILYIDDEAAMCQMARLLLENLGYHVVTRDNPIEALNLFRSRPEQFDLVITDMTMPHLTGDKLVQALLEIRADIPVLLCTGYHKDMDHETAGEIGATGYLEKPLEKKVLAATIRQLLDRGNESFCAEKKPFFT